MEGTSRLARLTAILTQLQTTRLVTAPELARRYAVSVRTIYRDIRTLEQSGVPIVTEEGKGYRLMEHYRLPPITFTEGEANALILAEQLVLKNPDSSLVDDYTAAMDKVKAVLRHEMKDKAHLLTQRTRFDQNVQRDRTTDILSHLQHALTNLLPVSLRYTNQAGTTTERIIEPFAIVSTENWLLIAWCRLREEFRFFRVDRMAELHVLSDPFPAHQLTLQEYFDQYQ